MHGYEAATVDSLKPLVLGLVAFRSVVRGRMDCGSRGVTHGIPRMLRRVFLMLIDDWSIQRKARESPTRSSGVAHRYEPEEAAPILESPAAAALQPPPALLPARRALATARTKKMRQPRFHAPSLFLRATSLWKI